MSYIKLSLLLKGLTRYLSITSIAALAAYFTLVTTVYAASFTLLREPVTDDFDLVNYE